jgi:2-polyprenyl-3-methyl-5-hydroxy-6-metoxy-1,4-benzoquinol methylase
LEKYIKNNVLKWLRPIFQRLITLFVYYNYDSSAYWKQRAKEPEMTVLWRNEQYNSLYREVQKDILSKHVSFLSQNSRILDIGCGIGIVSEMLLSINNKLIIDAVDFAEMITLTKTSFKNNKINYRACEAEEYFIGPSKYDLVLSSACYSMIRDIGKLERALANGAIMLKPGAKMVMIDPFHRWAYLARARYGTSEVVRFMKRNNLVLEEKSGVLFWPFREWLANSNVKGDVLRKRFQMGERILSLLGQYFWADYKILVFRKIA